jgi:hypothetical protein
MRLDNSQLTSEHPCVLSFKRMLASPLAITIGCAWTRMMYAGDVPHAGRCVSLHVGSPNVSIYPTFVLALLLWAIRQLRRLTINGTSTALKRIGSSRDSLRLHC